MTDNANRYGSEPLGKSVEEIEQESGNRVNSPIEGEVRRQNDEVLVPAIVNGNASGVPAILNPGHLVEGGSGTDDGTAHQNRDSSENS